MAAAADPESKDNAHELCKKELYTSTTLAPLAPGYPLGELVLVWVVSGDPFRVWRCFLCGLAHQNVFGTSKGLISRANSSGEGRVEIGRGGGVQ
jgi:hypothetical protein